MLSRSLPPKAAHRSSQCGRASRRNVATKTVDLAFVLDEGPHTYIERIVIRGNNATREEVIRREFDIAEGDAYNPNEIARAERRLKALRLFKSVKTATVPGSTPDRVVLNVDVGRRPDRRISRFPAAIPRWTGSSARSAFRNATSWASANT